MLNKVIHFSKNAINIDKIQKALTLNVFPSLFKLFQVALSLPISSATCERSFSAMRKIKTWLRTSMLQDRFNNSSILYIENDLNIDVEKIIDIFGSKNRYIALK